MAVIVSRYHSIQYGMIYLSKITDKKQKALKENSGSSQNSVGDN